MSEASRCGGAIGEFCVPKQQVEKEVSIQVMVPSDIHKQIALIGVENGESIRTVVLRGAEGDWCRRTG